MDERTFHDAFYAGEAERIFSSRLYQELLACQVDFLVAATPGLESSRVLSIGCGDGRRELAMAPHAAQILGFDLSETAIANARRRAATIGIRNVEFRVGDAGALVGELAASFDVIWCAGILHHLTDAQIAALLVAARAALRPGGSFVSMDPNARRAVNLFKPLLRRAYDRYHSAGERELRPGDVARMLRAAGFERIDVRFTDAFISPLAWAFPRLTEPVAPLLARFDQLLVRLPLVRELSSGFAAIARNS